MALNLLASSMNGRFSSSVNSFHSAPAIDVIDIYFFISVILSIRKYYRNHFIHCKGKKEKKIIFTPGLTKTTKGQKCGVFHMYKQYRSCCSIYGIIGYVFSSSSCVGLLK